MSGATNVANRFPLTRDPARAVDVYSVNDLPPLVLAPDGVMRSPLAADTAYEFHNDIVLPRLLIPTLASPGAPLTTTLRGPKKTLSCDGDSTPHIWGRNINGFTTQDVTLIDIGNGGSGRVTNLIDFVGGNGLSSSLNLFNVNIVLFKNAGHIVDMNLLSAPFGGDFFNESGWVYRATLDIPGIPVLIARPSLGNAGLPDNRLPGYTFIGNIPQAQIALSRIGGGKPANSLLYIDSATVQGDYSISNNGYRGPTLDGAFFRPDLAIAITAQANADIAITSFADSTADPGVDTTVNFGAIVDFTRGQVILLADEAAYDGLHTIVRVADDQMSFDINVVFSTSGAGTLKMVQHTVADNKFARDETMTVSGTTSYNGTAQVLRGTDTTFNLPQAFVADDATGTATSAGRDQTSVGVECIGNGTQADSKSIGGCHVTGGVATTALTQNIWTDLNLAAVAVANSNIERWSLTNTTTGELRYDGVKPFSGNVLCTMTMFGFAGMDDYEFRALLNGAVHIGGIVAETSTNNNARALTLLVPVNDLAQNDLIRIQVQNTSANDDVIMQQLNFTIATASA